MKKFTMSSILALLLIAMSACAPSKQNGTSQASLADSDNIVGGSVVMPGSSLSKQVFMLWGMTDQGNFICTATLVTQSHVLTAAHCVEGIKKMYAVFSVDGIAKVKNGNLNNNPDIIAISKGKVYPKWVGAHNGSVSGFDAGDIAILKLSKPAPSHMKITKLFNSSLRKGQTLVASGYGIISGTIQNGSGLLRQTTTVVEEPLIGKSEFSVNQTNGRGACSGDSGGPSFVQSSFGELVQVGVTSRGDQECSEAGIYTLVPAYTSWISSMVRSL